jgi:Fanconi anemia group M protein
MLAAISIDYGIPIIHTKNPKETASLLLIIAKRELEASSKSIMLHEKKPSTLKEQQQYIISSIPGIGPSLAEPLLKEFRTVKGVITASEQDLKNVKLIGKKKAKEIKRVTESKYED